MQLWWSATSLLAKRRRQIGESSSEDAFRASAECSSDAPNRDLRLLINQCLLPCFNQPPNQLGSLFSSSTGSICRRVQPTERSTDNKGLLHCQAIQGGTCSHKSILTSDSRAIETQVLWLVSSGATGWLEFDQHVDNDRACFQLTDYDAHSGLVQRLHRRASGLLAA